MSKFENLSNKPIFLGDVDKIPTEELEKISKASVGENISNLQEVQENIKRLEEEIEEHGGGTDTRGHALDKLKQEKVQVQELILNGLIKKPTEEMVSEEKEVIFELLKSIGDYYDNRDKEIFGPDKNQIRTSPETIKWLGRAEKFQNKYLDKKEDLSLNILNKMRSAYGLPEEKVPEEKPYENEEESVA